MKTKIGLILIAVSVFLSCSNAPNETKQKQHEAHGLEGVVVLNKVQREALNLKLDTFMMRNLTSTIKTNGQLEVPPSGSAEVTAFIGGNVKKINVFHGDKVQKGQVLAVLEHPNYIALQEDFSEVSNQLNFLEQEYNRQKKLFENNVGAGKDFQRVKADYNTAKAKFEGLKSRLALLHISPDEVKAGIISNSINIVSPINGYIDDVKIKVGTYVGPQDKLFEITDNSKIHADFMVYEKDVFLLKEGQKIHLTVANRPDEEFLATIFAIGKEFEPNTRAVHIHANLDENISGLIPGMYITGHIHTNNHYTRALPNDAVVAKGTKHYIFVVDNDALKNLHKSEEMTGEEHRHKHVHADDEQPMAFRMVEIIPGQKDENYTEIKLLDAMPDDTKVVLNAAYYLLSDMDKGETEHHH